MRRFELPDRLSDEVVEAMSAAFRQPGVFDVLTKELARREAELTKKLNDLARTALSNESVRPAALQTQGRLEEIQSLQEIVLRWTQ